VTQCVAERRSNLTNTQMGVRRLWQESSHNREVARNHVSPGPVPLLFSIAKSGCDTPLNVGNPTVSPWMIEYVVCAQRKGECLTQLITGLRWWITALLFFASLINFLNRLIVAILGPVIMVQFGLTNEQFATLTT